MFCMITVSLYLPWRTACRCGGAPSAGAATRSADLVSLSRDSLNSFERRCRGRCCRGGRFRRRLGVLHLQAALSGHRRRARAGRSR